MQASQRRTSCSMLADSFLSTPASLPAGVARGWRASARGGARAAAAPRAGERRHRACADPMMQHRSRPRRAPARRHDVAQAQPSRSSAQRRGGVPRSENENSSARPAAAGRCRDAHWRARSTQAGHAAGTHKTRRSGCRARCCRRGHKPPMLSSSCLAERVDASAPITRHGAECTRRAAAARGAESKAALARSRRRMCFGAARRVQLPARRTRLLSDSISRYFMRSALAPSACCGERGRRAVRAAALTGESRCGRRS
jgi:hypothetical protein